MELSQYARILRKRWWIFVLAMVVTAGSAFGFSKLLQTPKYESTVEVVIEPARPDFGLTQSAKWLLRSYMTVIDSNQYAEQVISRLELDMTPQQLRGNARFSAEDDRLVIRIEIEDTDVEQANSIAYTWAQLLIEFRDQRNQLQRKEDRVYAALRDMPAHSQSWPPRTAIILVAGAVFGLLIGAVIVFFLEWIESGIVRTPHDVEQWMGATVLGTVPPAQ